ncbi:MAG: hypothetical protein AVDCRST_MAG57-1291 [uncultured Blastococcus sp.]|uniref:Uncharacterized protein n=1 Tax=uncultured Blastococcus sp. TaxID=217144 RepID=A0A6J4HYB0_9ACTN|nr:MAG: hypothetical protein AVDCRST_MAG57-1291 [uncultured Blastococcus sp.]
MSIVMSVDLGPDMSVDLELRVLGSPCPAILPPSTQSGPDTSQ